MPTTFNDSKRTALGTVLKILAREIPRYPSLLTMMSTLHKIDDPKFRRFLRDENQTTEVIFTGSMMRQSDIEKYERAPFYPQMIIERSERLSTITSYINRVLTNNESTTGWYLFTNEDLYSVSLSLEWQPQYVMKPKRVQTVTTAAGTESEKMKHDRVGSFLASTGAMESVDNGTLALVGGIGAINRAIKWLMGKPKGSIVTVYAPDNSFKRKELDTKTSEIYSERGFTGWTATPEEAGRDELLRLADDYSIEKHIIYMPHDKMPEIEKPAKILKLQVKVGSKTHELAKRNGDYKSQGLFTAIPWDWIQKYEPINGPALKNCSGNYKIVPGALVPDPKMVQARKVALQRVINIVNIVRKKYNFPMSCGMGEVDDFDMNEFTKGLSDSIVFASIDLLSDQPQGKVIGGPLEDILTRRYGESDQMMKEITAAVSRDPVLKGKYRVDEDWDKWEGYLYLQCM